MPPASETDGIAALADALLSYIDELKTYRAVCKRHQSTAVIEEFDGCLRVTRRFSSSEQGITCLRSCLLRLPGWTETPFWSTQRPIYERLVREQKAALTDRSDVQQITIRGINWHERGVLIRSFVTAADAILHLDVLLPSTPGDLPELPLRRVADALCCHELLLPTTVLAAIPGLPSSAGGAMTLHAYLQRATPKNLLSSQCFWLPGAEQCPPPSGH